MNAYEIGYSYIGEKNTIITSAYYRKSIDEITRYTTVDANGNSLQTFLNMNDEITTGVEASFTSRFLSWWEYTLSADVYHNKMNASNLEQNLSNSSTAFSAKAVSKWKLPSNINVELSGRYRGKRTVTQGTVDPMFSADLAASKSFFDRKATLSVSVRDLFNSSKFESQTSSTNYTQESWRKRSGQMFFVRFSYRFGKFETSKKDRPMGGNNENGGSESDLDM